MPVTPNVYMIVDVVIPEVVPIDEYNCLASGHSNFYDNSHGWQITP